MSADKFVVMLPYPYVMSDGKLGYPGTIHAIPKGADLSHDVAQGKIALIQTPVPPAVEPLDRPTVAKQSKAITPAITAPRGELSLND